MSGTTRMSQYQKVHFAILDFLVQNEDNTGRCTNNPDGLPPHPALLVPPHLPSSPFLCRMPFLRILTQPSQFILAWDMHQICWLAYPVTWFGWLHIEMIYPPKKWRLTVTQLSTKQAWRGVTMLLWRTKLLLCQTSDANHHHTPVSSHNTQKETLQKQWMWIQQTLPG